MNTEKQKADIDRIKDRLVYDGPATNAELNEITIRFGARIHELRKIGYLIKTERKRGNTYLYTHTGFAVPPAVDPETGEPEPLQEALQALKWASDAHTKTGCPNTDCSNGAIPHGNPEDPDFYQCDWCAMDDEVKAVLKKYRMIRVLPEEKS